MPTSINMNSSGGASECPPISAAISVNGVPAQPPPGVRSTAHVSSSPQGSPHSPAATVVGPTRVGFVYSPGKSVPPSYSAEQLGASGGSTFDTPMSSGFWSGELAAFSSPQYVAPVYETTFEWVSDDLCIMTVGGYKTHLRLGIGGPGFVPVPVIGFGPTTTSGAAGAAGGGSTTSGVTLGGLLKAAVVVLGGAAGLSSTTDTSNDMKTSQGKGTGWVVQGTPVRLTVITASFATMSRDFGHTFIRVDYLVVDPNNSPHTFLRPVYYGYALNLDAVGEETLLPGGVDVGTSSAYLRNSSSTHQVIKLSLEQLQEFEDHLKTLAENPPNYTFMTNCGTVMGQKLHDLGVIKSIPLTPKGLASELSQSGNVAAEDMVAPGDVPDWEKPPRDPNEEFKKAQEEARRREAFRTGFEAVH